MIDHPLTIAIIGSRRFLHYEYMEERTRMVFSGIHNRLVLQGARPVYTIISGGATGADTLAHTFADDYGFTFKEYLPAFEKFGGPYRKADYYDRDVEIAEACHILIGFLVKTVGENHGSRITIKEALDRYKEVHIFYR